VAAIGDSITDVRSHGGKYLSYLKERCPQSLFDNYGVGGQMVNQMRRRFDTDVLQKRVGPEQLPYTHVIIFGGVNDLYSDVTAKRSNDKIEADLSAMYAAAKSAGMTVIALTIAPWGKFHDFLQYRGENTVRVNRWISEQAEHSKVDTVIDAYSLLSCGVPTELCPDYTPPFHDGIHFGPKGHAVLGAALHEKAFKDCL
jgi:lysophospholipase L1-like esterase